MSIRVERFTGTGAEWDAFGARQAGWTIFHSHKWREHIQRVFGHEVLMLGAYEVDHRLAGTLQLVRVRSPLFGHFLVSMPFVSYGGPLGTDEGVRALAAEAERLLDRDGADLLELRSGRELPLEMPLSHRKVTAVLPLSAGDPDAVFRAFTSKLRSQVRRPAKSNVEVRLGPEQAEAFHRVFSRHMRDLGTPTLPLTWFTSLRETFGRDAWFACAWLDGAPIAGGVGFRWDTEFEITWASALREHSSTSANMGVYWALIERAAREGHTRFNFGRCTPGGATHRFKSQWGAVDEPLYWYERSRGAAAAMPRQDSPKFALATRVWRRLPLTVTNALGPHLVRYIP